MTSTSSIGIFKLTLFVQVATQFDGKMLQYMITRCALLLRSYSTSMDQDQALMKETQVYSVLSNFSSVIIKYFASGLYNEK